MIKKEGVRYCRICNKEIEVYTEMFGNRQREFRKGTKSIIQSEEGVLFNRSVWFCNYCWDEIIKRINKNGKS